MNRKLKQRGSTSGQQPARCGLPEGHLASDKSGERARTWWDPAPGSRLQFLANSFVGHLGPVPGPLWCPLPASLQPMPTAQRPLSCLMQVNPSVSIPLLLPRTRTDPVGQQQHKVHAPSLFLSLSRAHTHTHISSLCIFTSSHQLSRLHPLGKNQNLQMALEEQEPQDGGSVIGSRLLPELDLPLAWRCSPW